MSLTLIGPDGPAFWPIFAASAEYESGLPDPLDRWSARVIGGLAATLGGAAHFPFGGPPWPPFIAWAEASGRIYRSPVGLLVHAREGMWVSFRGAIALPYPVFEEAVASPCVSCADQPCRTACPVGALTDQGYDVPACRAHLATEAGRACRTGCLVRRACPVGVGRRSEVQSAFHMAAFAPGLPA